MRISIFFILFSLIASGCSQKKESTNAVTAKTGTEKPLFDAELAEKLGADDYGMNRYVFAFLKAGPNRDQDSLTAAKLQQAHLANIGRLAQEGKLVLAGPFLDEGDIRGIYIFAVETVEEATNLTETDPAVQAGRLTMELHPWYGSAGLKQVNEIHKKLAKRSF
jgi:uncharacterized protein YciI